LFALKNKNKTGKGVKLPSELEEYLEFKAFQKANKSNNTKKKSKKRKKRSAKDTIFKGVTDPERMDALDYFQEARNIEKKDVLKGLYGAEKRAKSRAFNNATKEAVDYIKTADLEEVAKMSFKYKPKTDRRKNTAGAWDIPNNRAFYPEDWDKVKSGSKWAGEATAKGASAFGRGAKNIGKSAFSTGKDIFSFGKENKDYFSQDKRFDRERKKQDAKKEKWVDRTKKLENRAKQNLDNLKFKEERIDADNMYKSLQEQARINFEKEKADFMKDTADAQERFDKRQAKRDFEFKREKVRTRQAEREFKQNNPRKWYKGFRR
tara:strand:- start:4624 stop:5583 length:960 start_codon:yes stop_codon:yes gene_type:complete